MSENFAEMLANEEWKEIHTGEVVDGTVIAVKDDQIVLNIGYKADGIITRSEYTSQPGLDLTTVVSVGDEMKAKVLKLNDGEGQVLLTYRKLVADNGSKKLEEAFNNNEPVTATVTRVIKGGLEVVVDETRVFIPASLVSDSYVKDFSDYAGKEVTFVLTEYDPKNRKVIGDCKQLIVAAKKAAQEELLSKIHEGDTIEGTVKNVTDFGAFIDLGGVDGLLHISEMSWGRTENPKKVYKIGDSVKCFIKEINGDKIALSVKYPDQNPWNDASTKYAVGNVVTGKVARMTDFGAFVQLEDGIRPLPVTQQFLILEGHLTCLFTLLFAPDDIFAERLTFCLGETAEQGDEEFAGLGEGVDVLFFKDDPNAIGFQHPHCLQAVHCISCEAG